MHGAAMIASKELIQFLADNGAKVDVTDTKGQTPLSLAMTPRGMRGLRNTPNTGVVELLTKLGGQQPPDK